MLEKILLEILSVRLKKYFPLVLKEQLQKQLNSDIDLLSKDLIQLLEQFSKGVPPLVWYSSGTTLQIHAKDKNNPYLSIIKNELEKMGYDDVKIHKTSMGSGIKVSDVNDFLEKKEITNVVKKYNTIINKHF